MPLDGSCGVFHADGTQSAVYRRLVQSGEGKTQWIAVKTVSFLANQSTSPHDILKEANLLSEEINHPNVSFPGQLCQSAGSPSRLLIYGRSYLPISSHRTTTSSNMSSSCPCYPYLFRSCFNLHISSQNCPASHPPQCLHLLPSSVPPDTNKSVSAYFASLYRFKLSPLSHIYMDWPCPSPTETSSLRMFWSMKLVASSLSILESLGSTPHHYQWL